MSMYCWFLFGSALSITCLLTRRMICHAYATVDQRAHMDISGKFMLLAWEFSAGITVMERMYRKKTSVHLVPQIAGSKKCISQPCLLLLTKCNWTINNSRHWVENANYCLQTGSGDCTVPLLQKKRKRPF